MKTMKVAEVVLDYNLYPRNNVDQHAVRAIVEALKVGVALPAILIDRKSKRVVDGFHRTIAKRRFDGPDAEIDAIEKNYKNEAAIFQDAMRLNAAHGTRLDPCDRVRCTIIGERLGIAIDMIAGALNMSTDKLVDLKTTRTARGKGDLAVPIKRTVQHLAGRKLTRRQEEANMKLSGMQQVFYANQLIELIESKMLDQEDAKLLERLRHLHELLEGLLVAA